MRFRSERTPAVIITMTKQSGERLLVHKVMHAFRPLAKLKFRATDVLSFVARAMCDFLAVHESSRDL